MKILLTGSNGLLGQKLVKLLAEKKEVELLATSKSKSIISNSIPFDFCLLDITQKSQIEHVFNTFQPDVVINTAAITNVDDCEEDKESCWEVNVQAVDYLIRACEKFDSHLIHLSTDFVFDGHSGPYHEEDQPNPISYYGKSKFQAEQLLMKSSIRWAIVRTVLVYGYAPKMSRSNIVLWAKEALAAGKPLKIVNDQFRTPTLAEDLALACWLITKKRATGIYHISGKDFMSIVALVHAIADFYGYDQSVVSSTPSVALNQPAKRPPRTGFILNKAKKDLGYEPRSLEQGLSLITDQIKRNFNGAARF